MLFTDNMMMPAHVEHPYAAETMINYVYDPEVAAKIAAYVNYISPVKGVKEMLEKTDPELANNQLIFPPPDGPGQAARLPDPLAGRRAADAGGDGEGDRRLVACCGCRCSGAAQLLPWLFLGPGLAVAGGLLRDPAGQPAQRLAEDRRPRDGLHVQLGVLDLHDAIIDYSEQFLRSIGYAAAATVLTLRDRVPARVLHRVQGGALEEPHAAADHPAVLRLLRAADGELAADPRRRRLGRRHAARRRAGRRRRAAAGHAHGGDRRHHLQLPAVHGAAVVRVAGEDRPAADRGGDRPLREPRRPRSAR